ncbi:MULTISPECIES: TetR/AcrR family transcriptional regulator [unclassified Nocardia]|uniref:TetR/AcrR family transcriptional regulator n=1 Tax=unclassified Nocardia TaxID=2637762 RepID=UPI001CE3DFFD|nr:MULTISPECIES: TetR/AcrR family transcriptional regulator [unclassified Nocardia]
MTDQNSDVVGRIFGSGLLAIDAEQSRLLDAARAEFIEHGFRRTSVGDIARRAKVSRPTVYRRLGDKDQIVRQVVVREVVSFFVGVSGQVLTKETAADKAVEAFVLGVRESRRHPLVAALRQFEPETLTSFLIDHVASMEPVRAAIAMAITDDSLPLDAALRAAEMFVRVAASLLMVPSDALPIDTDEHARWFAGTYFPPIIAASVDPGPV